MIVKSDCSDKTIHIFKDTKVSATTQSKRYLGAALCSSQFREEYSMEKINKWVEELRVLSKIAKIEPQAANTCFFNSS